MTEDQKDLLLLCTAIVNWAKDSRANTIQPHQHFWVKDAKKILKRVEKELMA